MNEGDIVLVPLAQANGAFKPRPALLLRQLPPFGDYLTCGISTQLHQAVSGFDEIVNQADPDFEMSGLLRESLIRLGFLAVLPQRKISGSIGRVSSDRLARLLRSLSQYLVANIDKD